MTIKEILNTLSNSKFRSSFYLNKSDIDYYNLKGDEVIRSHAYDFIKKRLAPKVILNDTKQTPYKGHPIFKAQHACACCCRSCLNKWYKVRKDIELSEKQINLIVELLMSWIYKNINKEFKDLEFNINEV